MSSSAEWQFHLWPLDIGIGIRATELSEVFQEQVPAPHEVAGARALPRRDRGPVSRLPTVEDSVLDWESEGGSLG